MCIIIYVDEARSQRNYFLHNLKNSMDKYDYLICDYIDGSQTWFGKGLRLKSQTKMIVVKNVRQFFEREKKKGGHSRAINVSSRTSMATGLSNEEGS